MDEPPPYLQSQESRKVRFFAVEPVHELRTAAETAANARNGECESAMTPCRAHKFGSMPARHADDSVCACAAREPFIVLNMPARKEVMESWPTPSRHAEPIPIARRDAPWPASARLPLVHACTEHSRQVVSQQRGIPLQIV